MFTSVQNQLAGKNFNHSIPTATNEKFATIRRVIV